MSAQGHTAVNAHEIPAREEALSQGPVAPKTESAGPNLAFMVGSMGQAIRNYLITRDEADLRVLARLADEALDWARPLAEELRANSANRRQRKELEAAK